MVEIWEIISESSCQTLLKGGSQGLRTLTGVVVKRVLTDKGDHGEDSGDGEGGSGGHTVPRDPEGHPGQHHYHGARQVDLQDEVGHVPFEKKHHLQVREHPRGEGQSQLRRRNVQQVKLRDLEVDRLFCLTTL